MPRAVGISLLATAATPLPLGTFRLPGDPHLLVPAIPDDDPAARADAVRERAGQMLGRQRAIGGFNRGLDGPSADIAENTDWSQGLTKLDKEIGHLRQKHLAELRTSESKLHRFQRANPPKCALDILALHIRRAMRHLQQRRMR